ncbi:hypothetical protein FCH79_22120 [Pseudomonas koreensis]|nr:hypothetical protein [Pseudomonas koreensis]
MLEQGAEETVVLQGSHVGIRKKSAGIFSERDAKGTDAGQPFVYRVNLLRWNANFCSNTKHCGSWLASDAGNSVSQVNLVDAIAGKPAPTGIAFQILEVDQTPR